MEIATFGGGCFWCTEAIFLELQGVSKVVSGYSGGHVVNPTYREVCGKQTGHAEVIQVEFDPTKISFEELLEVFWSTHDPTTPNQQGNDRGPQYRSIILYHDDQQKLVAEKSKQLTATQMWDAPIVTEIVAFEKFYPAEKYHQDYYSRNSYQPYCNVVISPKLAKFRNKFKYKLKAEKSL